MLVVIYAPRAPFLELLIAAPRPRELLIAAPLPRARSAS